MDYNFLLDGINKIESMQEEQALALAMLQGYIFAEKENVLTVYDYYQS